MSDIPDEEILVSQRDLLLRIRNAIIDSCESGGFGMHTYLRDEYNAMSEALGLPQCDEHGVPDELKPHPETYDLSLTHEGCLFYVSWGKGIENMDVFEDGGQAALYYCQLKKEKDEALAKSKTSSAPTRPKLLREAQNVCLCVDAFRAMFEGVLNDKPIDKTSARHSINFCDRVIEEVERFGRERLTDGEKLRALLEETDCQDYAHACEVIAGWRKDAAKLADVVVQIESEVDR